MPFSRKFLDDICATADIVQIVGEIVELTPFPGDRWKGLCPFHNESGPSFSVSNRLFYCFGCGEGGDVLRFVQQSQKLSFSQAVRVLAERYNISDDPHAPRPQIRRAKPFVAGFKPPEGYVAPTSIPLLSYDEETRKLWENRRAEVNPFYTEPNHEELTTGFVAPGLVRELLEALHDG